MQYNNSAHGALTYRKAFKDLDALIDKWEILSENLMEKPVGVPVILPDILLVSDSGSGRTTFLRMLADYLTKKPNLMDFYGDVEFFEFMLEYRSPGVAFTEINRFQNAVSEAKGFRNEYRGIVFVDVDDWVDHFEEKHFKAFMEYISDNSDEWMVVLSVSRKAPELIANFEAFISAYVRVEKVTIERPTTEAYTAYLSHKLSAYGLELNDEAREIVFGAIKAICGNAYFDGYKTVGMLCDEIVYKVYTSESDVQKTLTADVLSSFAADGEYVQRLLTKMKKVSRIGF